MDKMLLI